MELGLDEGEVDAEEDELMEDILDDLPLAMQEPRGGTAPGPSRRQVVTKDAAAQTGGVKGAGMITGGGKTSTIDAGTLVKQMKVTLPLLRAVNADPGLSGLLLNYLIASTVRNGRTITLPKGADTEEVDRNTFDGERAILAAS